MLPIADALALAALAIFDELRDRLPAGSVRRPDLLPPWSKPAQKAGAAAGQDDHARGAVLVGFVKRPMQLGLEIGR